MSHSKTAQLLLEKIPIEGSIGGLKLREAAGLDKPSYKEGLRELVKSGIVVVGRGQGGSIRQVPAESDENLFLAQLDPLTWHLNREVREALAWEPERYWKVLGGLRQKGLLRVGRGQGGRVALNDDQGKTDTGGAWTRPDLTVVALKTFRFLPVRSLEVWTFEVKKPGDWSVVGVHEASAHGRRATHPTLLLVSNGKTYKELSVTDQQTAAECQREAARLGVGLAIAYAPYTFESWDLILDPETHEPSPTRLDGFLSSQLTDDNQKVIEEWLGRT